LISLQRHDRNQRHNMNNRYKKRSLQGLKRKLTFSSPGLCIDLAQLADQTKTVDPRKLVCRNDRLPRKI
jgi:hypothetical protein